MRYQSITDLLNKLNKEKNFTVEEWRILYEDRFNKALVDVKKKLTVDGLFYIEIADITQIAEYLFVRLYREWQDGDKRLFPPDPPYFWSMVYWTSVTTIYGNMSKSTGFWGRDTEDLDYMDIIKPEPQEEKFEFLDFYLAGFSTKEIGDICERTGCAISIHVSNSCKALSKIHNIPYDEIRLVVDEMHEGNRLTSIKLLKEKGYETSERKKRYKRRKHDS